MEMIEASIRSLFATQQTELGELPNDWSCLELGDVSDILTGFPFPSAGYSDSGTRLLRGSNVKRDRIEWQEELTAYWPNVTADIRKYLLSSGDVVVAMDGSLVGRSFGALSEQDVPALLLQRVARIRSSQVEIGYLKHWICSAKFTEHSDAVKTTTAIPHISPGDIRSFKVALPPTSDEQRKIGQALSDAGALIDSLEQLLTKKRQIKQGAMQELFQPGRLPFRTLNLEQISGFITKGATPTTYGFEWESEGIVFLRSECVTTHGLDLTQSMFISEKAHTALRRSAVSVGDLLMTITGNVGRVARATIDCNINQHIARIRISDPDINSDFVYYQLSRDEVREEFESITTGQAYPQLSLKQVRQRAIHIPELVEQESIAETLSDMDAEITTLESRLAKARTLKQAMAQALLTGRIRLVEPSA